jgi:hypothetical protein
VCDSSVPGGAAPWYAGMQMVRHFLSEQRDTLHDNSLKAAAAVRKEHAEKQAVVRKLSQAGDADAMCQAGRYRSKGLYGTTIVSASYW